jgi:hypothetical protein
MYEREMIFGYEHTFNSDLLEGWTFGLRYINRKLKTTIEDVAIGDAVARWCTRTSTSCVVIDGANTFTPADGPDFSGYFPYVLMNPGSAASVFIDKDGRRRDDPAYSPQWINLTADDLQLPKAKRTYEAIEFTFARPFDGTWGVMGSYVWANSIGNYEGAVKSDIGQTDTSITQDFDHSVNMTGSFGALPNMHRHTFKAYGTYSPLEGLLFGSNLTVQSGRSYGCLGYANGVDVFAPNSGTPSTWYCPGTTINHFGLPGVSTSIKNQLIATGVSSLLAPNTYAPVLVGRGKAGTTPWTFQLDMSMAYTYATDEYGAYTFSLDVFNIFDNDTTTRVVEQGEVRTSAGSAKGIPAPYYGMPRTYQTPRSVRMGIRFAF